MSSPLLLTSPPSPVTGRSSLLFAGGTALVVFIAYLTTLSPSVGPIDSGELTLVALRLGIAHPPGYPLFTWLGRIATMFGGEPALATNLMTALIAATGIGALFLAAVNLGFHLAGAATCALLLAFSATFWQQATAHEVYSFTILLLSLLILTVAQAGRRGTASTMLAGYLFGLSLAHQPTALLWTPALLALYLACRLRQCRGRRRRPHTQPCKPVSPVPLAMMLLAAVLLGASTVLGIIILARTRPLFNWGDPSTLKRFWAHITASQYHNLTLTSLFWLRLADLPRTLIAEFGLLGSALTLTGIGSLAYRNRRLLASIALLLVSGVFALGYQTADFRVQLLPQFLALSLAVGANADLLDSLVRRHKPARQMVLRFASILPLLAPGYAFFANFPAAREMRLPIVCGLGENLLISLPDSAVLITADDGSHNSTTYLQQVHARRCDVGIVHAEMLFSPVYRAELNTWLQLPRPTVSPHASGREQEKQELLAQLIRSIPTSRPVFVTTDMLIPEFFAGPVMRAWQPVPTGIVVRLLPANQPVNLDSLIEVNKELWSQYRHTGAPDTGKPETGITGGLRNPALADIVRFYPSALNNFAAFCREQGRYDIAVAYLNQALRYPVPDWLRQLLQHQLKLIPPDSGKPDTGAPATGCPNPAELVDS